MNTVGTVTQWLEFVYLNKPKNKKDTIKIWYKRMCVCMHTYIGGSWWRAVEGSAIGDSHRQEEGGTETGKEEHSWRKIHEIKSERRNTRKEKGRKEAEGGMRVQ